MSGNTGEVCNPAGLAGRAFHQKQEEQTMPEPLHPTNENWELFDPETHPPPRGVSLLVINEGGVLLISQWYEGALAWGFKPKIPASVKQRVSKKQQQQCEASNADQSKSGAVDPFDPEWLKLELPV